jgi:hypothetical protein
MSLINDALKRATQARTPKPEGTTDAPMRTAESHGSIGLPTYFMPAILFVVTGACFFVVRGWDAHRHAGVSPQPVVIQAREAEPAPTASTASAASTKISPVPAAEAAVNTEVPHPIPDNRQFAVEETQAPPPPAEELFRLQGIFYRPSKPCAVVNSQTVYIGDTVGNGKVRAITRESVTITVAGQDKVLVLR